jgi:hypothetical protein
VNTNKRQDVETKHNMKLEAHEKVLNEVKAIRRGNTILPSDRGVSQLSTMVQCFARPGDVTCKKKKSDLAER